MGPKGFRVRFFGVLGFRVLGFRVWGEGLEDLPQVALKTSRSRFPSARFSGSAALATFAAQLAIRRCAKGRAWRTCESWVLLGFRGLPLSEAFLILVGVRRALKMFIGKP